MIDAVARAYAVLGLKPGASLPDARRRYRFLAQRWHPDRYASDPTGQAEATERMARVNAAYKAVSEHLAARSQATIAFDLSAGRCSAAPMQRLSRETIEAMVKAIGSNSPVDSLLDGFGWVGGRVEAVLCLIFATGFGVRLLVLLWRRDFAAIAGDPDVWILLAVLLLIGAHEFWVRRRLLRGGAEPRSQA